MKLDSIAVKLALEEDDWLSAIREVLAYYDVQEEASQFSVRFVNDYKKRSPRLHGQYISDYSISLEMADGRVYSWNGGFFSTSGYRNLDLIRSGIPGIALIKTAV